jgi:malate synthase
MEDAATAEIARTQLWQWVHQEKAVLDDGSAITADSVKKMFAEELQKIRTEVGADRYQGGKYALAAEILENLTMAEAFTEFLTLAAYEHL